jgi:hypothetical protein
VARDIHGPSVLAGACLAAAMLQGKLSPELSSSRCRQAQAARME